MPKHGSIKSHIRKVYACLAVTCHLHFWQNDRDFLRASVVTRGWNGYRNKSQHRKSTLEKKILPPSPRPFNHESGALTTELSPPPTVRQSISSSVHSGMGEGRRNNGRQPIALMVLLSRTHPSLCSAIQLFSQVVTRRSRAVRS